MSVTGPTHAAALLPELLGVLRGCRTLAVIGVMASAVALRMCKWPRRGEENPRLVAGICKHEPLGSFTGHTSRLYFCGTRDLRFQEHSGMMKNNSSAKEVRMPTLSTSHKSKTRQTDSTGLQEQIRSRAYEIYEQRNRTEGHDLEDWLQAEAELTGTKTQQPLALDQWVAYDGWHCNS